MSGERGNEDGAVDHRARPADILATVEGAAFRIDADLSFRATTDGLADAVGCDPAALRGADLAAAFDDSTADAWSRAIREAAGDGPELLTLSGALRRAGGATVPCEARVRVLTDGGAFAGAAGVVWTADSRAEAGAREQATSGESQRLAALAALYTLVGEINVAALGQSTREEVEQRVCEHLVGSPAYDAARLVALDRDDGGVAVRASAGHDGDPPADVSGPDGDGPTARALRSQEPQVVRDDASQGPSTDHGYRAVAAIPVVHEETLYGVLNVSSDRADAFEGREREAVARLGRFVGHALAAIERKTALTSDEVVELELRLPGVAAAVLDGGGMSGRVDVERTVPAGDGTFLQYATATPDAADDFERLLTALPHADEYASFAERDGEVRYRIHHSEPPLMSIVADEGGLVRGAIIDDGDLEMYVDLPAGADVRPVVQALQSEYPGVELVAQRRTVRRTDAREAAREALTESLTDRQRAALEAAYYAGFFEWPRDTTAEELAETMSISSPTLHHHLRKALRKLLAAVFERGPAGRDALA